MKYGINLIQKYIYNIAAVHSNLIKANILEEP